MGKPTCNQTRAAPAKGLFGESSIRSSRQGAIVEDAENTVLQLKNNSRVLVLFCSRYGQASNPRGGA
jgi:hypothetical protein